MNSMEQTTTATAAPSPIPTIDVTETWAYYARVQGSTEYTNKADFNSLERLFLAFKNLGYNQASTVVLIGGTNEGQSALNILQICPSISLIGFEIQPQFFQKAAKLLSPYAGVSMQNLGWSDQAASDLPIGGRGQGGGLYDPAGQRGWKVQKGVTASAERLDAWTSKNLKEQQSIAYVLIDKPLILLDNRSHTPIESFHKPVGFFRRHGFGKCGIASNIREENGHLLLYQIA